MDINDRNIVTAVLVDKTDYGYALYAEIPQLTATSNNEGGQKTKPIILKSEGRTFVETRENLDWKMDKPIYLGAVQTLILTEKLARYDVEEYVLRLRQTSDYRKTVHLVVTTSDPEQLLSDTPENAESVGFAIEQTLTSMINTGQLYHISLIDVLQRLSSSYKQYLLPTVDLVDQEPCFTGFSVFSGGMKTAFIPASECKSIVFMHSKNAVALYTVPYKDTSATLEVKLGKKNTTPYYVDGKISFDLVLAFKATLLYPAKAKPVTGTDIAVLQATLQAMLEKEFSEMFHKSQTEYKFDTFRLWSPFRITFPEDAKKMNWAGEYPNVSLNLSISVELKPNALVDYEEK